MLMRFFPIYEERVVEHVASMIVQALSRPVFYRFWYMDQDAW